MAQGKRPFLTVDEGHRELLDNLVTEHGIKGLWSEEELVHLNLAWHRLDGGTLSGCVAYFGGN